MSPVIGITSKKNRGEMANYTDAIKEFGGEPLVFASLDRCIRQHREAIPEYLDQIDGLLLPGGGDINPCLYFQERHCMVKGVSRSRDALEIWLFQNALEANVPVFGICRGIQIMSVAMRGDLHQHIPDISDIPQALPHKIATGDAPHEIEMSDGSLLHGLIGESVSSVNSSHHQAVDAVGEGLVVTARASDGTIEAIEHPDKRFMLGVQYHPERMLHHSELREHAAKLFTAFIAAAS